MLHESIRALILDEQARQQHRFIEGVDVERYLAKLGEEAEFVADYAGDRCRGFAAFYANQLDSVPKQAYITLLAVDPSDRGDGLGRRLVEQVFDIARERGFTTCRLEVADHNAGALAFYEAIGFHTVEARAGRRLLEISL